MYACVLISIVRFFFFGQKSIRNLIASINVVPENINARCARTNSFAVHIWSDICWRTRANDHTNAIYARERLRRRVHYGPMKKVIYKIVKYRARIVRKCFWRKNIWKITLAYIRVNVRLSAVFVVPHLLRPRRCRFIVAHTKRKTHCIISAKYVSKFLPIRQCCAAICVIMGLTIRREAWKFSWLKEKRNERYVTI